MTAALEFPTLQADMEHLMRDGTVLHGHEHGAGARHASGANQAIGRRRGGFTADIQEAADAPCHVMAFIITAYQESGYSQSRSLLQSYHCTTSMADKGYDGGNHVHGLHKQGEKTVASSRRTIHHPRHIHGYLCKERLLVDVFFNHNEEYCSINTDVDRLTEGFSAFVFLPASPIRLRQEVCSPVPDKSHVRIPHSGTTPLYR